MDHFSVTQLSMFARCAEAYRRRYVEGEIKPPGIALSVGSGLHAGAEHAMLSKAIHFADVSPSDVADAAVAGFDSRLETEGLSLTADEAAVGQNLTVANARDRVATNASFWAMTAQPEYQPADEHAVEKEISIPLGGLGLNLLGYVDLEDQSGAIVDWKTSSRTLAGTEKKSLQLTAYALAYHREHGQPPPRVVLDVINQSKKAVRREVLSSVRTVEDYRGLLARIEVTLAAIRAGNFPPCNPDSWNCSRTWCGFFDSCKFSIK